MTDFEVATESTIAGLRAGPPRELTDTKLIVEYIAHLELRTFHLRQSIMNMGNAAVPMLLSFMDDESKFSIWMQRRLKADPKLIEYRPIPRNSGWRHQTPRRSPKRSSLTWTACYRRCGQIFSLDWCTPRLVAGNHVQRLQAGSAESVDEGLEPACQGRNLRTIIVSNNRHEFAVDPG